jgi:hypothetical protein
MTYIPEKLKTQVRQFAGTRCEYCLISGRVSENPHEYDHIVAIQHSGQTVFENICLACFECNRQKGPNLCSIDTETGDVVRLFDPRHQSWKEHFELQDATIIPLTAIGRVTVRVLDLNSKVRLVNRTILLKSYLYPEINEN